MQAGKTIAAKREKPASDSERTRARIAIRKRKLISVMAALALGGFMLHLGIRAIQGWLAWTEKREEVIVVGREPSVEVIDDTTGKQMENLSSRMKEFIAEIEDEFILIDHKVVRAHIPVGKMREVDLEVEGFQGLIKVSIDRNAAVLAEDAGRMIRYFESHGIEAVEYVDVRLARKAYWK